MFLADLRLESFFGAFLDFGVGKLADLMDDELLGDEELKSDIGETPKQRTLTCPFGFFFKPRTSKSHFLPL